MTIDNLAELTDSTDGGMREKWENSRSDLWEPRLRAPVKLGVEAVFFQLPCSWIEHVIERVAKEVPGEYQKEDDNTRT